VALKIQPKCARTVEALASCLAVADLAADQNQNHKPQHKTQNTKSKKQKKLNKTEGS
jgi:hypothetical protein